MTTSQVRDNNERGDESKAISMVSDTELVPGKLHLLLF